MRIKGQIPPPPTHTLVKQVLKMINHFDMYEYEFADAIGVNRSTLSKFLKGTFAPNVRLIIALVNAYPKINTNWLFKGRGKMWEGEK